MSNSTFIENPLLNNTHSQHLNDSTIAWNNSQTEPTRLHVVDLHSGEVVNNLWSDAQLVATADSSLAAEVYPATGWNTLNNGGNDSASLNLAGVKVLDNSA